MKERILEIVSLIAQFVMEERDPLTEMEIVEELLAAGFESDEINAAFSWIANVTFTPPEKTRPPLAEAGNRVFSPEETRLLSREARGLLIRLRELGVLDDELCEEIIDRARQMAEGEISLKELKSLAALTLFTRAQDDWTHDVDFVFEDDWSRLYH
ncbi:MAG TPA: DUF494 family protein [Desulfuromonadales bacterium]|nr:DUF494 family protein [Desulfuromonadales bacterium]